MVTNRLQFGYKKLQSGVLLKDALSPAEAPGDSATNFYA